MQKQELVLSIIIVSTLKHKIMAKLYFDGVCVMHDLKENVKQAAEMCPASINIKVVED